MRSCALVVLALFVQAPQASTPVPDDFALRFEFGCPERDTIDTFTGTYRRNYRSQSARIEVSPELKRALFSAVQEAGFFGLSSRVHGSICEPMILSTLEVQANGVSQTTTWDSCNEVVLLNPGIFKIDPAEADVHRRLYRLESLIVGAFRNQKGVRRLRGESAICL
jgi:hypothetical protein